MAVVLVPFINPMVSSNTWYAQTGRPVHGYGYMGRVGKSPCALLPEYRGEFPHAIHLAQVRHLIHDIPSQPQRSCHAAYSLSRHAHNKI
jgi:hypothetical protein